MDGGQSDATARLTERERERDQKWLSDGNVVVDKMMQGAFVVESCNLQWLPLRLGEVEVNDGWSKKAGAEGRRV